MLYSLSLGLFKVLYKLFYTHTVDAEVFKQLKTGGIIAPNHASFFDPPLIGISCPEPTYYLAKKKLFKGPIIDFLLRRAHAFPIEGSMSDLESIKMGVELVKKKNFLVLFPEGTRTYDGELLPFNKGVGMMAHKLRCPVIPAYIRGTFEAWPRSKILPRPFYQTSCTFGEPIPWDPSYVDLPNRDVYKAIVDKTEKALVKLKNQQ